MSEDLSQSQEAQEEREPAVANQLLQFLETHGDRLARMVRERVVELLAKALEHKAPNGGDVEAKADSPPPSQTPQSRRRRKPPKPCSVEGCEQPARARGLCSRHYQRQRYEEKRARGEMGQKVRGQGICEVDGCQKTVYARAMCSQHFMEWVRNKRKKS